MMICRPKLMRFCISAFLPLAVFSLQMSPTTRMLRKKAWDSVSNGSDSRQAAIRAKYGCSTNDDSRGTTTHPLISDIDFLEAGDFVQPNHSNIALKDLTEVAKVDAQWVEVKKDERQLRNKFFKADKKGGYMVAGTLGSEHVILRKQIGQRYRFFRVERALVDIVSSRAGSKISSAADIGNLLRRYSIRSDDTTASDVSLQDINDTDSAWMIPQGKQQDQQYADDDDNNNNYNNMVTNVLLEGLDVNEQHQHQQPDPLTTPTSRIAAIRSPQVSSKDSFRSASTRRGQNDTSGYSERARKRARCRQARKLMSSLNPLNCCLNCPSSDRDSYVIQINDLVKPIRSNIALKDLTEVTKVDSQWVEAKKDTRQLNNKFFKTDKKEGYKVVGTSGADHVILGKRFGVRQRYFRVKRTLVDRA